MYDTEERDGSLRAAVERTVAEWPGVSTRTTFGCPAYVADGVLFAVVSDQGLSLTRLSADQRSRLASQTAVEPFEVDGRRVTRWATVSIDPSGLSAVVPALRQSYESALV